MSDPIPAIYKKRKYNKKWTLYLGVSLVAGIPHIVGAVEYDVTFTGAVYDTYLYGTDPLPAGVAAGSQVQGKISFNTKDASAPVYTQTYSTSICTGYCSGGGGDAVTSHWIYHDRLTQAVTIAGYTWTANLGEVWLDDDPIDSDRHFETIGVDSSLDGRASLLSVEFSRLIQDAEMFQDINSLDVLNFGNAAYNSGTIWNDKYYVYFLINSISPQIIFDESSNEDYSGPISGNESLVKRNSNVLIITGANTYTGGTFIDGGTLRVTNDGNLGATSGGLIFNGGTLQFGASFTTARTVTLGPAGGGFDTDGHDGTLTGNISGPGGLIKLGLGTLTLAGANTYTGGTLVAGGTLRLGAADALPSDGIVVVANGAMLDFDGYNQRIGSLAGAADVNLGGAELTIGGDNSDSTYSGTLTGTGGLTKLGGGKLIFNGNNTYTGDTTVSGGTLVIGDAVHPGAAIAGAVAVKPGGTLQGHGTVGGNVTNNGLVIAGGSIGRLTVGSFNQEANGSLSLEVSPSLASQLAATGAASLDGTLNLVFDPGLYSGRYYPLITAATVTGTFARVTGGNPGHLLATIRYASNEVDLVTSPDTVFSAETSAMVEQTHRLSELTLRRLDEIDRGGSAGRMRQAAATSATPTTSFGEGVVALNQVVPNLPQAMAKNGGWFRALGSFASFSDDDLPGFRTRGGGFVAGIDRSMSSDLVVGAALGYVHTDLSEDGGSRGTLDTPSLSIYGSARLSDLSLEGSIGYGYNIVAADRPVPLSPVASSSHGGHAVSGALQASAAVQLSGMTLVPKAGLKYAGVFQDGFAETGGDSAAIIADGVATNSLRPFIGLTASSEVTTSGGLQVAPELRFGYSHEVLSVSRSNILASTLGSVIATGILPSRDQVQLGLGIAAQLDERLALFADYDAAVPVGNYTAQTLSAGLRLRF